MLRYELLTFQRAFPKGNKTTGELSEIIRAGKFKLPKELSASASVMLSNLMCRDPKHRWTLAQLEKAEWLQE